MAGNRTESKHPVEGLATQCAASANSLKEVPPDLALRNTLRQSCIQQAPHFDSPPSREALESAARRILIELDLPESYVGWTMVVLSNEFYRTRVTAVPLSRRLLLLPEQSVATPNLQRPFTEVRAMAKSLGMKVLVAESSPQVMQLLFDGSIEAIVGVASLDLLEKALDLILLAGIPAMAVPLLDASAEQPFDPDWVEELLQWNPPAGPCQLETHYAALLRSVRSMFEPAELVRLVPRLRKGPSLAEVNGAGAAALEPIAATETIAHDFLALGGKYARPFITLAAYQALTRQVTFTSQQPAIQPEIPDAVRRVALSIEIFHKASLVHDDIEDADEYRYGRPTLHLAHGLSTAINVGDYLIGLGYSLVSRESATLGADVVGDIIDLLADAHLRLSEGQGAELLWRDARDKNLSTQDALEIYALKTSPAFEAALLSGLRCAGPIEEYKPLVRDFCQHLGIAFQILNDLKDWQGDQDNKLQAGLDTLSGRPTVLWALALAGLPDASRQELIKLTVTSLPDEQRLARVRELYTQAAVFSQADQLIEQHKSSALSIVGRIEPANLQRLLHYLVETVLFGAASLGESIFQQSLESVK